MSPALTHHLVDAPSPLLLSLASPHLPHLMGLREEAGGDKESRVRAWAVVGRGRRRIRMARSSGSALPQPPPGRAPEAHMTYKREQELGEGRRRLAGDFLPERALERGLADAPGARSAHSGPELLHPMMLLLLSRRRRRQAVSHERQRGGVAAGVAASCRRKARKGIGKERRKRGWLGFHREAGFVPREFTMERLNSQTTAKELAATDSMTPQTPGPSGHRRCPKPEW